MPRKMTKAEVFIIESLRFEDEDNNYLEGKFLSQILNLGGKNPKYYYIRTKRELEEVLKKFQECNYRYLHLSCHGSTSAIDTTLDTISFAELKKLVQPYLRKKRLFMSTCLAVNHDLARTIIPSSECFSIIGPTKKIDFDDAAIIWASFYHLMFKEEPSKMERKNIKSTLQKTADTFGISLNYFSISEKHGYKGDLITPKKKSRRTYPNTL
jgi:hypothetical protein